MGHLATERPPDYMKTKKLFLEGVNFSTKWEKYFDVYDEILKNYKDKKITFVEIGILNGGSLEVWKKYFHPESRIIGIDFNPDCKKFEKNGIEIYIGDQSDENFWDQFYKKIGKIDILLDDGGHTNTQQIITTVKSLPNINDNGILIVEDTHSSYMRDFGNPSKYSFINFSKKIIDDVNFKFPNLGNFKTSFNDYVYSIQYYESFVVFFVNRKKTLINKKIKNNSINNLINKDYRYHNTIIQYLTQNKIIKKFNYLKKLKLFRSIYALITHMLILLKNIIDNKRIKKFFK